MSEKDQDNQDDEFEGVIKQQVNLSWAKTIEISFNAVKVRLTRSLITASGVVLAITFLMSTFTQGVALKGLNDGIPTLVAKERASMPSEEKILKLGAALATEHKALKGFVSSLKDSDFVVALKALDDAEADGATLSGAAELRVLLKNMIGSSERIQFYEKLRRKMIKRGEAVGLDQSEQKEAESRNLWLVSLALLVALVGIINAMLMSVTERFREIGTMKCLGALDTFIIKLFLIESSFQGFFGTLLGVIIGLMLSLFKLVYVYGGSVWTFLPMGDLGIRVLLALAIGTILAVVGALYPAFVAAKMEPVVAMRVDQ